MMTEREKKAAADKIYANIVIFFNNKMISIEIYQENSRNSVKKNGFESANAAVKMAESLKGFLQEKMGAKDAELKQKKTLSIASRRQCSGQPIKTKTASSRI